MPGFKDAHTHSAMTFLRSYADDLPLQDWLFKQVFPMEAKPYHMFFYQTIYRFRGIRIRIVSGVFDPFQSDSGIFMPCLVISDTRTGMIL